MPDDVWVPAWVEWRYDDDYIGWATLPPYARFNLTFGIQYTTRWIAPAHYWNFIRYNRFGSVIRYRDTAQEEYARCLIHNSRNGPQYRTEHERIINRGIDRSIIERRGNVRFTSTEVREFREQSGERMTRSNGRQCIEIYRPTQDEMQRSTGLIEAQRVERNLSIDVNKVERPRVESRAPEVQVRQSQRDRQEMRRELIRRHEHKQRPSPPAVRKAPQIDRRRENFRIYRSRKPEYERRSENKNER